MTAVARVGNQWVLPAGLEVLPADAPRPEWLAERRKGIGGSDIALLMGVSHYSSQFQLWADKTGRSEGEPFNWAMQRGHWLEAGVAEHFAERTGLELRRSGLVANRDDERLRATPDRLTSDGGLVQVKTFHAARAKVATEWWDGVARHAYVQGQYELLVTGRSHVWFVAYPIDQEPLVRGPFERDDALCERMRGVALSWWDRYVATDEPPPVDLVTVTDEEISLRWPVEHPGVTREAEWPAHVRALLAEREELGVQEKTAHDRRKQIDQALKVMTGDAEVLTVDERPVLTLKTSQGAAYAAPELETDLPEVWAKYVKRSGGRKIYIKKGWGML